MEAKDMKQVRVENCFNSLVVPGCAGRCYCRTDIGYPTLQVLSAEKAT